MFVLGITGGVGAGKSRVLEILREEHGAYVLEADRFAEEFMQPGKSIYKKVVSYFGPCILAEDGSIDRKKLAGMVFANEEKLDSLNKIVHPAVKEGILQDIEEKKAFGKVPLYVIEAALLLQDGYDEICDEIWYVHADIEERINRLMKSRSYTRERCENMMNNQPDEAYFRARTVFTLENSGSFSDTAEQIKGRLNKYKFNDII